MIDSIFRIIITVIIVATLGFACLTGYYEQQTNDANAKVQTIYNKLLVNVGEHGMPPLVVLESDTINAWTDGSSVTFTTGLLKAINYDEDQIAMILAHELAHNILGHLTYAKDQSTVLQESEADKYGAFLMIKSGYDICNGRMAFAKFLELWGDDPTEDHPPNAYRINQLKMPWCSAANL